MNPANTLTTTILAACLALVGSVGEAATPGKQIRVKVSLHIAGVYQHDGPKTIQPGEPGIAIKRSIDDRYSTEYVVAAHTILTGLQKTNPLDPTSRQELEDYNSRVAARNDRIYHSADKLRGKGPGAPAGLRRALNPMAMMNPAMLQKIMACGLDQSCKQRIAMDMMAQQQAQLAGPGGAVMADMQAISNQCLAQGNQMGSKGYEDCMNAEGNKRSTVKRSAADDEPEIAELPDRYFLYTNQGSQDCQFKSHTRIYETGTNGHITDGEGAGRYVEADGAIKGEGNYQPAFGIACRGADAVFDAKTNLFWGAALVPVDLESTLQTSGDTGGLARGLISTDISEWMSATLQGAPASGTKSQKFGYRTATLSWSYVRE